jgi:hypothetical protein
LEREARAAHAADERDQRGVEHHRHRRAGAGRARPHEDLADLSRPNEWIRWLSVGAIALATVNMFGGFAVTPRMLPMFRK